MTIRPPERGEVSAVLVAIFVAIVVAAIGGWTLAGRKAHGHSWYPADCCSDKDCKPIDARDVGESGKDYTYRGMKFPKEHVRPSPDDQYHACVMSGGFGYFIIRCMWRPVPGS